MEGGEGRVFSDEESEECRDNGESEGGIGSRMRAFGLQRAGVVVEVGVERK
jgi:hypothetical protein